MSILFRDRIEGRRNPDFFRMLQYKTLQELRLMRDNLGLIVHRALLQSEKNKLVLNSGLAPGLAIDALASNDGSSNYLAGSLVNYSSRAANLAQLGSELNPKNMSHIVACQLDVFDGMGIKDLGIVAGSSGFASGSDAGKIVVYAGTSLDVTYNSFQAKVREPHGSPGYRQVIQETAAILTLMEILEFLEADFSSTESDLLTNNHQTDALLPYVQKLEDENKIVWKELFPLLRNALNGRKISVGESFTAGILSEIFTSIEGATEILDWSLIWYDPRLKMFVGVPEELVTEEHIASPKTIGVASYGLLHKAPSTTQFALGTTGFANFSQDNTDHFSVGIASRNCANNTSMVLTAQVNVTSTTHYKKSKGKRQFTRHLGATTGLFLLANNMGYNTDNLDLRKEFSAIADRLYGVITKCGNVDLKVWSKIRQNKGV